MSSFRKLFTHIVWMFMKLSILVVLDVYGQEMAKETGNSYMKVLGESHSSILKYFPINLII